MDTLEFLGRVGLTQSRQAKPGAEHTFIGWPAHITIKENKVVASSASSGGIFSSHYQDYILQCVKMNSAQRD